MGVESTDFFMGPLSSKLTSSLATRTFDVNAAVANPPRRKRLVQLMAQSCLPIFCHPLFHRAGMEWRSCIRHIFRYALPRCHRPSHHRPRIEPHWVSVLLPAVRFFFLLHITENMRNKLWKIFRHQKHAICGFRTSDFAPYDAKLHFSHHTAGTQKKL